MTIYKTAIKPLLFRADPEKVHDRIIKIGSFLGRCAATRKLAAISFCYRHGSLIQTIDGIKYLNPVGLAAGFDKDANLTEIIPAVGFGFEEIGSVTALPCLGNPKPRLWRLPQHSSLVVNYGLKNEGCEAIANKLRLKKKSSPLGISIAKTNCKETADAVAAVLDYHKSFITLEPFADYITINISCPNAFGGQPFSSPELLEMLLAKLDAVKTAKPRYLKISPDLSIKEIDAIISVSGRHNIQGFIVSNLLKNREKSGLPQESFSKIGKGGLSGKPVEKFANLIISHIYAKTKGRYTIIGCGGIFSADDAYAKIKAGADLVQLITGMIYEGPGLIKDINKGLVISLKRDGFTNISEAVGIDCK